jgi:hypothetical protein
MSQESFPVPSRQSLFTVSSVTKSQMFTLGDHIEICGCEDFVLGLEMQSPLNTAMCGILMISHLKAAGYNSLRTECGWALWMGSGMSLLNSSDSYVQ